MPPKFTVGKEEEKVKIRLLTWFAGLAMRALLERPDREGRSADDIARQAYAVASAMVREDAKHQ